MCAVWLQTGVLWSKINKLELRYVEPKARVWCYKGGSLIIWLDRHCNLCCRPYLSIGFGLKSAKKSLSLNNSSGNSITQVKLFYKRELREYVFYENLLNHNVTLVMPLNEAYSRTNCVDFCHRIIHIQLHWCRKSEQEYCLILCIRFSHWTSEYVSSVLWPFAHAGSIIITSINPALTTMPCFASLESLYNIFIDFQKAFSHGTLQHTRKVDPHHSEDVPTVIM